MRLGRIRFPTLSRGGGAGGGGPGWGATGFPPGPPPPPPLRGYPSHGRVSCGLLCDLCPLPSPSPSLTQYCSPLFPPVAPGNALLGYISLPCTCRCEGGNITYQGCPCPCVSYPDIPPVLPFYYYFSLSLPFRHCPPPCGGLHFYCSLGYHHVVAERSWMPLGHTSVPANDWRPTYRLHLLKWTS